MQSAELLLIEPNFYSYFEIEITISNSVSIIQEKVESIRSLIYKGVNSNWNSEEPTDHTPIITSSLHVVKCSISHVENDLK
jgi:hypothetical protein